jgi:hypothetical protein
LKAHKNFCSPGRLLFCVTLTVVTFQVMLSSFCALFSLRDSYSREIDPKEQAALISSIRNRLACHEAELQGRLFPEGRLFSRSFYAFSLVNIGLAPGTSTQFRESARAELKDLIADVEPLCKEAPFSGCQNIRPRGGIIWAGNINLMRAGYVLLGGNDPHIIHQFHESTASLYEDFSSSENSCLESYPQQFWPCDNCAALTSLRLHDDLYGTTYGTACDKWSASMTVEHLKNMSFPDAPERRSVWPVSFLGTHQVVLQCAVKEGPG